MKILEIIQRSVHPYEQFYGQITEVTAVYTFRYDTASAHCFGLAQNML